MGPEGTRTVIASAAVAALAAAALVGVVAGPAVADPAVAGTFAVAGIGTNNQITQGPDGAMWVTLQTGPDRVARIAMDGTVTRFPIDQMTTAPVGITTGPDGRLWATITGAVVSFDPANPDGTDVKTAVPDIADARAITLGPDGNLWTASNDKVIKVVPGPPVVAVPITGTGLVGARWIASDGVSGLWIADFGGGAIVNVTTAGGATAYMTGGGPQGVAFASGMAAYSDPGTNPQTVGRITPGGTPQATASPLADPFGVTVGADGAFWIAQFANDTLGRLTTAGALTTLPLTLPANAGPRQISAGPEGTVWATIDVPGDDAAAAVLKVSGVTAPAPTPTPTPDPTPTPTPPVTAPSPPAPDTTITKGPKKVVRTSARKAKVTFRFISSDASATFQCRIRSGADFRACASPRVLRLKPGRYVFAVRAVAGGLADETPATKAFRIRRR